MQMCQSKQGIYFKILKSIQSFCLEGSKQKNGIKKCFRDRIRDLIIRFTDLKDIGSLEKGRTQKYTLVSSEKTRSNSLCEGIILVDLPFLAGKMNRYRCRCGQRQTYRDRGPYIYQYKYRHKERYICQCIIPLIKHRNLLKMDQPPTFFTNLRKVHLNITYSLLQTHLYVPAWKLSYKLRW